MPNTLGWYDITAYGAVLNGSTDNASAIASAVSAAGVGGTLYFPPGVCAIGSGVAANVARQTWIFAPGSTLKALNTATISNGLIDVTAADVALHGDQSVLDGNRGHVNAHGVFGQNADRVRIEGFQIEQCLDDGVLLQDSTAFKIRNNFFTGIGSGSNGTAAIFCSCTGAVQMNDFEIAHNLVDLTGEPASTQTAGILVRGDNASSGGPRSGYIHHNTLRGPANPTGTISVACEVTENGQRIDISDNVIENFLIGPSVGNIRFSSICRNLCTDQAHYGIEVATGAEDLLVSDNVIEHPGGYGVRVTNTNDVVVANNIVFNPAATMAGVSYFSAISSFDTENLTVADNSILLETAGVEGVTLDAVEESTVTGNRIRGYAASCTGVALRNASGSFLINSNRFCAVTAIALVSGSPAGIIATGNYQRAGAGASGSPSLTTSGNVGIP